MGFFSNNTLYILRGFFYTRDTSKQNGKQNLQKRLSFGTFMCHVIDSMLYPPENTLVQFSLYPLKVKNIDISQALSIGGYKRWHTLVSFILCRNIDTLWGFFYEDNMWYQSQEIL